MAPPDSWEEGIQSLDRGAKDKRPLLFNLYLRMDIWESFVRAVGEVHSQGERAAR